jgi:hypothetical protein
MSVYSSMSVYADSPPILGLMAVAFLGELVRAGTRFGTGSLIFLSRHRPKRRGTAIAFFESVRTVQEVQTARNEANETWKQTL